MAGFFGFFDYTKPGPGVPKPGEEDNRSAFKIFFGVLQRKFWKLLKLNMLFSIFNILGFVIAFFMAFYLNAQLAQFITASELEGIELVNTTIIFWIFMLITTLPIISFGPARAGFESILRNYAKEEHAFMFSDFMDNFKSNFKQSLIVSLINIGIFFILFIDFLFYRQTQFGSFIVQALVGGVILLISLIYIMMNLYIYPLMVTFELSTKDLIRNAFLFAMIRFLPNAIILVIGGAISSALFFFLNEYFVLFIAVLITYSLVGFIYHFYAQRGFKKYILEKMEEKSRVSSQDKQIGNNQETVFKDASSKENSEKDIEKIKEKYKH